MSWRFYPLASTPRFGVLQRSTNTNPVVAEFLTPEQAKAIQTRKAQVA